MDKTITYVGLRAIAFGPRNPLPLAGEGRVRVVPQAETPAFAAPATLIPAFSRQREKVRKGLRGHMRFP